MVTVALVLGGLALLCWPAPRPRARLGLSRLVTWSRIKPRRVWLPLLAFGGVVGGTAAFGPAGALAAGMLAAAGWCQWRARRRTEEEIGSTAAMAEALRAMVAELRAGAHPAVAAEAVAAEASTVPAVSLTMRTIAGAARLGGELGRVEGAGPVHARLAGAWSLSRRHGLPLADVLDAVSRDLSAAVRFAAKSRAAMAGPRASASVLALLPAAGIALGQAMGADPVHVLTSTPAGQILLLLGCGLIWAGVAWSVRLTAVVMPR